MRKFLQKNFISSNKISPVLLTLLIVGLIQSKFTNIGFDESYYWRFAQDLDWGYFDHPPFVALMIAIGSNILPGTLGVRLMTIILSLSTYYLIWILIPKESRDQKGSTWIFFVLIMASPLLNIYSFITTPDVPLIFFSALYLVIFNCFLENKSFKNALLLGIVMACLIYSKYHGLLVIFITVISQIRLFRSPYFYLAGLIGILLYIPHLWWQYEHDFVSFEYHLSYRSVLFSLKNVFGYFLNTVLVLNPFLFPFFLYSYFKYSRNSGIHSTTYNVLIWGFLGFFCFTSFRGHVEPQWIVVVVIPLIVYFHQYIFRFKNLLRPFKILAMISIAIVLIGRIVLMLPLDIKSEFHSRGESFYKEIESLSDNRPVVFVNSYTEASKYTYYTGQPTFSYNFISFRKNQYDLWDYHSGFHNKDVFFVLFPTLSRFDKITMSDGDDIHTMMLDKMPVINNLDVEILDYKPVVKKGETIEVKFKVHNPYDSEIDFNNTDRKVIWQLYLFHLDKERITNFDMNELQNGALEPHTTVEITGNFTIDYEPGSYSFGMHVYPELMFPITVSKRTYPLQIIE